MPVTTDPIHVLHVDDDPDFTDLAATFLEREDDRIAVRTADCAEAGLAALADHDVDCVVSDYDMPGRNGIEFLEAVRETHPDLPFVLFTGKGSEEIASDAISAGVTDYLQKESGTSQYAVLANRITNVVEQHRSRRAVEATERKLSEIADKTDDVLFMFSGDWSELLFVNSAYEAVWGDPVADLEAEPRSFLDSVHPEDREAVRECMEGLSSGEASTVEYRVQTSAEETRWVRTESKPILDDDGTVARIVGFVRDITERKRRERDRRRNERRYQAVFDDPNILVGLLDTDGTILDINETAMEYVDVPRSTVIGESFPETPWFAHSADAQREVQEWIERAAAGEYVDFEVGLLRPDGSPYAIEGVFRPVTDDDGEVVSLLVSDRDVTERAARARELRRVKRAMDEAPVGITITDPSLVDNPITYVNDSFLGLTGYDEADVLGRNCRFLQGPEPRAEPVDAMRTAIESAERVSVELRNYRKDGTGFWNQVSLAPVRDDDGSVTAFVGFQQEVTERKERERELARTRELLAQTERIADVGGWEIDTDTREVFWTANLFDLLGWDGDEEPPLSEALDVFHEADRPEVAAAVERALDAGEAFDVNARFRRPDGEMRWLRIQGEPTTENGEVHTLRGAVQDITEQVRRERDLERAQTEYQELFNGMNDSAWVLDDDGSVLAVNDAAVTTTGYSRAELLEMRAHDVDEGLPDDEVTNLIQTMPEDGVQVFETVHESKTGERIPVEISSSLISYEGETKVLSVARDISDRKRRERQLEEFASIVSHDLRNPLNVAQGRLELASEACDSPHLDAVAGAHDRMEALIEDLLALAREGSEIGELSPVALGDCVGEAWRNVATEEAGLRVEVERTVRAAAPRLKQLFENLFRNAVEHAGSDVTITVGGLDGGFYVEDDGPGIPPEDREQVFEAGFSTGIGGTGFGLSIVKQIVDAHGWTVRITEGTAGGARFEIIGVEMA